MSEEEEQISKIRRIVREELEHHEFQLGEDAINKIKEATKPVKTPKKCVDCGHEVRDTDKYCPDCGEEQLED